MRWKPSSPIKTLQKETHPDKRRILLQLLADEVEKLPEPIKRAEILRTNQISIT
jgi:hypothetical protein